MGVLDGERGVVCEELLLQRLEVKKVLLFVGGLRREILCTRAQSLSKLRTRNVVEELTILR